MDYLEYMGRQYTRYREGAGVSIAGVADLCGMDIHDILMFEGGGEMPEVSDMERMCECVGITPTTLCES